MRFRYSAEQIGFLRMEFPKLRIPELTLAFNERFDLEKTEGQIRACLNNHQIHCGRPTGNEKGAYRLLTKEQAEFLREHYPSMKQPDLVKALNREFGTAFTPLQIRTFMKNHGIQSGRTGYFEPGHQPWNKGTHFVAGGRSSETRFKPGSRPKTWVPVGTETIDRDGYRKRKIADDPTPGMSRFNWRFVHRMVWEERHGPIPKGHIVAFKDGDRLNCEPDNLILLTMAENLYLNRNGYSELPDELKPSMRALAKLETKRFSVQKSMKESAHATA